MKVSNLITGITVVLILLGYVVYFYFDQIQVAPTFKITINNEQIKLMGEEGKFGVVKKSWTDKRFLITNEKEMYNWYFWGEPDELTDKELIIVATKKKTGEKLQPFASSVHLNNGNESTAYSRIELVFPTKGIWKLDVFVDGNLWGTIDVKVRNVLGYRRNSTFLTPPSIKPSL